jgi:murein DD-endopeptidase MepM/ murein hydrolase activator NlpD
MRTRYVLLVIDRSTSVIRRSIVSLRAAVCLAALAMSCSMLVGLGAMLSAGAEIQGLQTRQAMLNEENASYRAAAAMFTEQTRSLQGVIDELSISSETSRVPSRRSVAALHRARAAGGASAGAPPGVSAVSLALSSPPEDVYRVLRGVLQVLMNRLPSIEQGVERREALAAATPSIWPAPGWLTAPFGVRSDPFTGERGFHQGIDISTAEGEPVYATADGVVESASYSGDYGNLVELRHSFGLATRYGHLTRFAAVAGEFVKRGDTIGYVGATGRATGPHLHYEILVNGEAIDPLQMLTKSQSTSGPRP